MKLMYLHLGGDTVVALKDVLGVFDLDNASWSPRTREFLRRAQEARQVIAVTDDIPRSFVLCRNEAGEERVYLSLLNPATLLKRAEGGSGDNEKLTFLG